MSEEQQVQKETTVTGKTVLSFTAPTPMWATWLFRIVFILTTAATMVIAADPAIDDALKVRIGVYLKAFDFVIWSIARALGVQKEDVSNG